VKLLLDQNLSYRLIKQIQFPFVGSEHVSKLNLENASDVNIWNYAKRNDFSILTFDVDFYDLSVLYGHPPKIILIKSSNQTSQHVKKLIDLHTNQIIEFLSSKNQAEIGCLVIGD